MPIGNFLFARKKNSGIHYCLVKHPIEDTHWPSVRSSGNRIGVTELVETVGASFGFVIMVNNVWLVVSGLCCMLVRREKNHYFVFFLA